MLEMRRKKRCDHCLQVTERNVYQDSTGQTVDVRPVALHLHKDQQVKMDALLRAHWAGGILKIKQCLDLWVGDDGQGEKRELKILLRMNFCEGYKRPNQEENTGGDHKQSWRVGRFLCEWSLWLWEWRESMTLGMMLSELMRLRLNTWATDGRK